jgi:hypothetical protein
MTVGWSSAFRRSPLGAAVFDVATDFRYTVLAWASIQDVPTVRQHALHVPAVEAWAVLDGGVVSLVIADLDLAGPAPFDGETVLGTEELRSAHRAIGRSPDAVEQAELLASCHDAVLLRWVAATLTKPVQAAAARSAR